MPIFGKLADIFRSRRLYAISICLFLLGSVWAGLAQNMTQLIFSRVLQGIGAGGNFALVYIVLTDISAPENRAKTLSLASFTIFSLFAYSPLFIQGALDKTPLQMSVAMLTLSLGWSIGALVCGQIVHRLGQKPSTILGSLFLAVGGGVMLTFSIATSLAACSVVLGFIGVGMGFVSMATLLAVQDSLDITDLGVATASHQFFRTLGGTIGVGISGSFVTMSLSNALESLMSNGLSGLPPSLKVQIEQNIENIFRPEVQLLLAPDVQQALKAAVARGVSIVFWISLLASMVCLIFSAILPAQPASQAKKPI